MGTWILIIILAGSQKGGVATAEFNSKTACLAAATEVQKAAASTTYGVAGVVCAAKGEK
jgi:hypothetical protein